MRLSPPRHPSMSTENSQQASFQPVFSAGDGSGSGTGRGRGHGRGRGRGRGGRSSSRQHYEQNPPVNVIDQQLPRPVAPSTLSQAQFHAAPTSSDRRVAMASRPARRDTVQQQQQQQQHNPSHTLPEAGQMQAHHRAQGKARHRGLRQQNRPSVAAQTGAGTDAANETPSLKPLELPDCIVCCEPMQVWLLSFAVAHGASVLASLMLTACLNTGGVHWQMQPQGSM